MYMIYNIFDRIQKNKQRKKQEQIFTNVLKNCLNYDINRRNKRDFKLYGISEQLNIEGMFRIIESIPSCTERKDMMKNGLLKE